MRLVQGDFDLVFGNIGELNLTAETYAQYKFNTSKLRKLLVNIRDQVINPFIAESFDVGGIPAWPEITPPTERSRRIQPSQGIRGPSFPLIDTGRLWRSATAQARYIFERDSTHVAMFYASGAYSRGRLHNLGYDRPHRPFTELTESELNQIDDIFINWADHHIKELI